MSIFRFSVGSDAKSMAVPCVFAIGVVCWANFIFNIHTLIEQITFIMMLAQKHHMHPLCYIRAIINSKDIWHCAVVPKKRCEAAHWGASEERTRTIEEWLANPRTSSHLHGLLDISTSTRRVSIALSWKSRGVHGKYILLSLSLTLGSQAHQHTHSRRSRPLPMPNDGRSTKLWSIIRCAREAPPAPRLWKSHTAACLDCPS